MKILVISDTHRNIEKARKIIRGIKSKIEYVIHLGDNDTDAEDLSYEFNDVHFIYVAGNCDWVSNNKREKIVEFNGKKILLTHGDKYGVKYSLSSLVDEAKKIGVDCVLFGHTHIPYNNIINGVYVFNPGSISLPRSSQGPTYGIISINDDGKIDGSIVNYKTVFSKHK